MYFIQQKVSKGIDPPQVLAPDMVPPSERGTAGPVSLLPTASTPTRVASHRSPAGGADGPWEPPSAHCPGWDPGREGGKEGERKRESEGESVCVCVSVPQL